MINDLITPLRIICFEKSNAPKTKRQSKKIIKLQMCFVSNMLKLYFLFKKTILKITLPNAANKAPKEAPIIPKKGINITSKITVKIINKKIK